MEWVIWEWRLELREMELELDLLREKLLLL
jgi:hypothetical protein